MDSISSWDGESQSVATRLVSEFGNGSVNTAEVLEVFKNFVT